MSAWHPHAPDHHFLRLAGTIQEETEGKFRSPNFDNDHGIFLRNNSKNNVKIM